MKPEALLRRTLEKIYDNPDESEESIEREQSQLLELKARSQEIAVRLSEISATGQENKLSHNIKFEQHATKARTSIFEIVTKAPEPVDRAVKAMSYSYENSAIKLRLAVCESTDQDIQGLDSRGFCHGLEVETTVLGIANSTIGHHRKTYSPLVSVIEVANNEDITLLHAGNSSAEIATYNDWGEKFGNIHSSLDMISAWLADENLRMPLKP